MRRTVSPRTPFVSLLPPPTQTCQLRCVNQTLSFRDATPPTSVSPPLSRPPSPILSLRHSPPLCLSYCLLRLAPINLPATQLQRGPDLGAEGFSARNAFFFSHLSSTMYLNKDAVEAHFRTLGVTEFSWFSVRQGCKSEKSSQDKPE